MNSQYLVIKLLVIKNELSVLKQQTFAVNIKTADYKFISPYLAS